LTLEADRSLVAVWGAAFAGQIALGCSFGLSGELYTGQGLGNTWRGWDRCMCMPHDKLTIYDSFGDKDAWVVISEVMFRL